MRNRKVSAARVHPRKSRQVRYLLAVVQFTFQRAHTQENKRLCSGTHGSRALAGLAADVALVTVTAVASRAGSNIAAV